MSAFEALSHLKVNPARILCALIPWYALKKSIESTKSRTQEFS